MTFEHMEPVELRARLTAEVQTAGPVLRAHLGLLVLEMQRLAMERDEACRQLQELRQRAHSAMPMQGPPC